jgi:hypothetical protein
VESRGCTKGWEARIGKEGGCVEDWRKGLRKGIEEGRGEDEGTVQAWGTFVLGHENYIFTQKLSNFRIWIHFFF